MMKRRAAIDSAYAEATAKIESAEKKLTLEIRTLEEQLNQLQFPKKEKFDGRCEEAKCPDKQEAVLCR